MQAFYENNSAGSLLSLQWCGPATRWVSVVVGSRYIRISPDNGRNYLKTSKPNSG